MNTTSNIRIIQLNSKEGFISAFFEMVPSFKTHIEAYEALESEYESIFNKRRYSNFESFRQVRDRKLTKPIKK